MTKLPRPDKDKFIKDYNLLPFKKLCNIYGVCEGTIRRFAKEFGCMDKKSCRIDKYPSDFTDVQQQIFNGAMLGDGSLTKSSDSINSSFAILHGKMQIDWLYWKMDKFSKFIETDVGESERYKNAHFKTVRLPIFSKEELKWYKRNEDGGYILRKGRRVKMVPEDLKLTPLTVAVWFFDDGCRTAKISS